MPLLIMLLLASGLSLLPQQRPPNPQRPPAQQPAPQAGQPDKPLRVMTVLQDRPNPFQAQLLGPLDRPVGGGITLGGKAHPARATDKGNLEIDVEGNGKYRTLGRREIVAFSVKGEGEKPKSATLKLEIRRQEDGTWVYRNLTVLAVQIETEQFAIADADGNGAYNDAGADGMCWEGQAWLFPLPAEDERWCSAAMDFGGIKLGPLGGSLAVQGRPLATGAPAALPVLKGVNEERVKLGLTPRPEDPKLSGDLQKHCQYMAANNALTHPEDKGKPGFSEEGHQAGLRSILSRGMPAEHVARGMVQTYFHRQDVIRPSAIAFGVGYEGAFGGIDGRSKLGPAPANFWPVLCPVPGQQDVGLAYGKEAPDACPGDNAAGYPVTAYFGTDKLRLTSHALKAAGPAPSPGQPPLPPTPKGAALPAVDCYVYDPQTGASADFTRFQHCVCIIPKDPLKGNTLYEVSLEVEVAGKPWSKTWRFSTGTGGFGGPRRGR